MEHRCSINIWAMMMSLSTHSNVGFPRIESKFALFLKFSRIKERQKRELEEAQMLD
jgi:hypothetical protein